MFYLFQNLFLELLRVINALFVDETHADQSVLQFVTGCLLDFFLWVILLKWRITISDLRIGTRSVFIDETNGNFSFERNKTDWLFGSSFDFVEIFLDISVGWSLISNKLLILSLIMLKILLNYFFIQIINLVSFHRRWVLQSCWSFLMLGVCFTQEILRSVLLFFAWRLSHLFNSKNDIKI